MEKFKGLFTLKTRKYIYSVVLAAVPILILCGAFTDETQGAIFVNLAAAILGLGSTTIAINNVSPNGIDKEREAAADNEQEGLGD